MAKVDSTCFVCNQVPGEATTDHKLISGCENCSPKECSPLDLSLHSQMNRSESSVVSAQILNSRPFPTDMTGGSSGGGKISNDGRCWELTNRSNLHSKQRRPGSPTKPGPSSAITKSHPNSLTQRKINSGKTNSPKSPPMTRNKSQTEPEPSTSMNERKYECPSCADKFKTKSLLKSHVRSHTEEKQFSCGICSKKFSNRNHFDAHERVHTGAKPYTCEVCSRSFSQFGNLKAHMTTHTGELDERKFECQFCKARYRYKRNLTAHLRGCEFCPRPMSVQRV